MWLSFIRKIVLHFKWELLAWLSICLKLLKFHVSSLSIVNHQNMYPETSVLTEFNSGQVKAVYQELVFWCEGHCVFDVRDMILLTFSSHREDDSNEWNCGTTTLCAQIKISIGNLPFGPSYDTDVFAIGEHESPEQREQCMRQSGIARWSKLV